MDEIALSFFISSTKTISVRGEWQETSGWSRQVVYQRQRPGLGYGGSMQFFKLEDGRLILTNDLWDQSHIKGGWVSSVPYGELVGHKMATRVCQLKTKEAIDALVAAVTEYQGNAFSIRKDSLSDKQAYDLKELGLPEITQSERRYEAENSFSFFCSCEGALLTHVKIGTRGIEPLHDLKQLSGAEPATEPVFVLYEDESSPEIQFGLSDNGNHIDLCHIRDMPEWTDG